MYKDREIGRERYRQTDPEFENIFILIRLACIEQ